MTEREDVERILAECFTTDSVLYRNGLRTYDVLSEVGRRAEHDFTTPDHGTTWILVDEGGCSKLERYLDITHQRKPYNGQRRTVYDSDISNIALGKQNVDGANIVDSTGELVTSNVMLPSNLMEYCVAHGIEVPIEQVLDEADAIDGVGSRKTSILYATEYFGPALLAFTLHERNGQGRKELSIWHDGRRKYNSAGRQFRLSEDGRYNPEAVVGSGEYVEGTPELVGVPSTSSYASRTCCHGGLGGSPC